MSIKITRLPPLMLKCTLIFVMIVIGLLFIVMPAHKDVFASTTGITEIVKGVYTMEDDGTLLDITGDADPQAVTKKIFQSYPDEYDFIVIYTTFPSPIQIDFFFPAKRDIRGLGSLASPVDLSSSFGSNGTLKGVPVVHNIDSYYLHTFPTSGDVLHELGHYWLAYLYKEGLPTHQRIAKADGHWSPFLSTQTEEDGKTYLSPLKGDSWKDEGNGRFSWNYKNVPSENWLRFNDIELYLMGLLPRERVRPLLFIETNDPRGQTVQGTAKQITVEDIIEITGEPRALGQTNFKVGFVLLTRRNEQATAGQVGHLKWVAEHFPEQWNEATKRLSTITPLIVAEVVEPTPGIVQDAATAFVASGTTPATVRLGSGERAALIRDQLETLGRVSLPALEQLADGQKPTERNLAKEQAQMSKVLDVFVKLAGHRPNFQNIKEDLAWNTMMYRIRFPRNLNKERAGIMKFKGVFKRNPTSPLDWATVRAWGYALQ